MVNTAIAVSPRPHCLAPIGRRIAVGALMALGVTACAESYVEVRSVLVLRGDSVYVQLSDSLPIGVAAAITFENHRRCREELVGRTDLSVDGPLVVVEPYDSVPASGPNCPDYGWGVRVRTIHVDGLPPGSITVRLIGRNMPKDTLVSLERFFIVSTP